MKSSLEIVLLGDGGALLDDDFLNSGSLGNGLLGDGLFDQMVATIPEKS